jgi:hypothetical protein
MTAGLFMGVAAGGASAEAGPHGRAPNWTPRGYAIWDDQRKTVVYSAVSVSPIDLAGERVTSVIEEHRPLANPRRPITTQAIPDPGGGCSCTPWCSYVGSESGCFCDPYVGQREYYECTGCNCNSYTDIRTGCFSDPCRICNPDGTCNA